MIVERQSVLRLLHPSGVRQLILVGTGRQERAKASARRERPDLRRRFSRCPRLSREHVAVAGFVGGAFRIGCEDEIATSCRSLRVDSLDASALARSCWRARLRV